jgi:hypothetical protein
MQSHVWELGAALYTNSIVWYRYKVQQCNVSIK